MAKVTQYALAGGLLLLMMWLGIWLSDWLVSQFQFFLPAPLLGLLGLFTVFVILRQVPEPVTVLSQFVLTHMAVLFVPATLSVVLLKSMLVAHLWPLLFGLLVSTLISMAVTVCLMSRLLRTRGADHAKGETRQ